MFEIKLIEKRNQHFYKTPEGIFPSSTTILGILNKPALMPWAVKMTVAYLNKRLDDIKSGKLELTKENSSALLNEAKLHHKDIAFEAVEIGTRVHAMIENHVNGKEPPEMDIYIVEKELVSVRKSYQAYLDWENEYSFELIGSEVPIYSIAWNGYGGTLDIVAYLDGKRYIIDLKTSSGIYDEYAMQIASYRFAYSQLFDVSIDGMGILRLDKKTGKFEWKEYADKDYWHALKMFGHLCNYWHLKND